MDAAARAEARRKAILSRGSDRLAKLTTSARGENAPAYMHDGVSTSFVLTKNLLCMFWNVDPPLPNLSTDLKAFVGEETTMPTPPTISPSPTPTPRSTRTVSAPAATSSANEELKHTDVAPQHFETTPDPTVWSPEHQRAFMQAIMTGAALPQHGPESLPISPIGGEYVDPTLPPMDNSFAAMLFPQQQGQGMGTGMGVGMGNGAGKGVAPDLPLPSRLQQLMPFVHLVMMWCLLAYFVMWEEPRVYEQRNIGREFGVWRRWAELCMKPIGITAQMLQIQIVVGYILSLNRCRLMTVSSVAFLLGFHDVANCVTFSADIFRFCACLFNIFLVLLTCSILNVQDAVQPPTLIALALPHLPPTVSSIIMNTLKYLQMGSLFLDDLSGLVVGLGFIVFFSGWLAA